MASPAMGGLKGLWVKVEGLATRPEMNGQEVFATDFDEVKGRYKCRVSETADISLKAGNLIKCEPQKPPPAARTAKPASGPSSGSRKSGGNNLFANVNWQQALMIGLFAWWAYSQVFGTGGGGSMDSDSAEYDTNEDSYLRGVVIEATTHSQFLSALAQHRDDTGLPVVVDFFSNGCGPCRMIAPAYTRIAKEYAGRAVFMKVNVNTNWETSQVAQVSSMPTFQFFLNGQKKAQFSGADQNGILHYTNALVTEAETAGTYPGMEITQSAMEEFYKTHTPGKNATAASITQRYKGKTAKLMRLLIGKYGEGPKPIQKGQKAREPNPGQSGGGAPTAGGSSGGGKLSDATMEELEEELQRRKDMAEPAQVFVEGSTVASKTHQVLIIGGGPAGLSAAIYAARAGLEPVVVAPSIGGQLLQKGVDVENYPGVYGKGATGREIVEVMRMQAAGFKSRLVDDAVVSVDFSSSPFEVTLNNTGPIRTHTLILATGADSKWLNATGEYRYRGNGVSSCATCDGFLFRGQDVVVIGGGDTAMEEALVLARTSNKVVLIHRRDSFRASSIMAKRVLEHDKIQIMWNSQVHEFVGEEVNGQDKLTHVSILTKGESSAKLLAVGAAFVAIGHDPNTKIFADKVSKDEQGYLKRIDSYSSRTSVNGVFAAGDVQDKVYRQAVTSAGTGAMAALDAERWLSENGHMAA